MLDPGAQTHQGMYGWSNDTNVTGTVTAADATYDRKDIVYIQVNDSDMDTSGAKNAPVLYLAGSATADPKSPDLPPRSFLVGTITVPKAGGGSPTVQINTARYVAAGAALPVWSAAERDAIPDKYDGLLIKRMDLPGRPDFVWDGTKWNGQEWTSYTPDWAGWANPGGGFVSTGSYMMVGPKLCIVRMKLKAGSASPALGTGQVAVTLPFTSAPDQATLGSGEWLGTGINGGLQTVILSNPPNNSAASILVVPSNPLNPATSPGYAGYGYGASTEVHCTITYRTA